MHPLRDEIETIEQNGITKVAFTRMHDPEVIPLWFGEGDVVTPDFVRDAAKAALDDGQTFYAHTRGRPELRAALQVYLDGLYGLDIDPARITVPGSAMLGVTIAAQMALSNGDHGLIVSPVWPNIEAVFRVTGAELGHVRQRLTDNGWQLTAEEIIGAIRPDTKAIFVNSPCNPTGWVMDAESQAELLAACRERGVLLIADEVYHRTVFDGDHAPSFLEVARHDDPLVVVNGFSKAWAMTGWRVGWVVTPARHRLQWTALSECFNTGATVFAQLGAVAALQQGEDFVRQLQQQYRRGREIVDHALRDHPVIDYCSPAGAFYAFPKIADLSDSLAFVEDLLAEEDVGLAPGYTFGPGNESHFRLCFAQSHQRLEEGLQRLTRFVERHHGIGNLR
ncbi:MAG: pyridoxal phosphate-dependent aminotransferase [Gammaproteobacteria bacterium]|nr:pyridoxal phosphate-dependent aminotransferase [Gammaproteobacteria bacterium]